MKSQVLDYLDNLVFNETGKHLDSLQVSILKGVYNSEKYSEIAKNHKCSKGHVKDEAYELWRILSKTLGEDINKSNFCATIERLGITNTNSHLFSNTQSHLFNPIQVNSINFCRNPELNDDNSLINNDTEEVNNQNSSNPKNGYQLIIEQAQKKAKLETIPKLLKIGLTAEQIAEALGLSLEEVEENI